MKIPFEEIIYAPHSTPSYSWSTIIMRSLQETHDAFGGYIEKAFFKKMMDRIFGSVYLSLPYARIYSIFKQLKNPKIVELLCILFPANLTDDDVINAIIPSLRIDDYPETCINNILEIGIKLRMDQVIAVAVGGYSIVKLFTEIVTYDIFKKFLIDFIACTEVINILASGHETEKLRIYGRNINALATKYNIVYDDNIIIDLLGLQRGVSLSYIAGIHILMRLIGVKKLPNECFHNLKDYNVAYVTHKEILILYDIKIDRDIVFYSIGVSGIPDILFMIGADNDYNPKDDLIAILMLCITKGINHEKIVSLMNHFLDNGHIKYDEFLIRVISTGLLNQTRTTYRDSKSVEGAILAGSTTYPAILLKTCIYEGIFPDMIDIQNIFMFCDFDVINILLNNKITPTCELVSKCLNKNVIYPILISTLYDDNRIYEYLDILENDVDMNRLGGIGYVYNNTKVIPDAKCDIQTRKLYDSLSLEDREIFVRMNDRSSIYEIMLYDITLTQEYVTYILGTPRWMDLILLLTISKKYDYVINMITYDTVLSCNNSMGRYWLVNNIINNDNIVFSKYHDLYVPHQSDRETLINALPKILIKTILPNNYVGKFTELRKKYAILAFGKNTPVI